MVEVDFQLDHVVLLIPYESLLNLPSWITDNFTLSPGGRHGDNKTENRLVLFRDGTYLELIAFISDDPEKRRGHWWDKPFGVVDFAFTTEKALDHGSLVDRLKKTGTGLTYAAPKPGGRVTDGKEIKWRVTFAEGVSRGNVPFFCEDVTPRSLRVPATKENTTHPCGALGMAGILLEVGADRLEQLSTANAAVLDLPKQDQGRYSVGVPKAVEGLNRASIKLQEPAHGSDKELALTLILQTEDHKPKEPIRERIGDGLVSIDFQ